MGRCMNPYDLAGLALVLMFFSYLAFLNSRN